MLSFQPVTIEDRQTLQSFFDKATFGNCDFSFSNIFGWKHAYDTTFAVEDGWLYIRFQPGDELPGYLFPVGEGDLCKAIGHMQRDAAARGTEFRLYAVTQKMFDPLDAAAPGEFVYETDRDWYEYLYLAKDLIALRGNKYQAKRNHINKFKRTYPRWEYLPITHEIIPECLELYDRWCIENREHNSDQSLAAEAAVELEEERIATLNTCQNFEKLGLTGGALRVGGRIVAYSYGQPLTRDIFGIHAEKCLYEIDGGFAMINHQFALHNCAGYTWINREEDLGIESLRQSKMSYHPAILLEKGWVRPG